MTRVATKTTLLYIFKQVELAIKSHLEKVVSMAGLTSQQYTALTVLEHNPGIASADLARYSFVRPQTMAEMVVKLEDCGLVTRQQDPDNKLRLLIFLSDQGSDVLRCLQEDVEKIDELMLSGFSQKDVAKLEAMLRECRRSLGGIRQKNF